MNTSLSNASTLAGQVEGTQQLSVQDLVRDRSGEHLRLMVVDGVSGSASKSDGDSNVGEACNGSRS
ncbi:hypothetical protein [Paraburkholderia sp. J12]|uniref:hypothetical protein n=1 Tax=Paraburkholderia sp. J12 TaxID=2805432 RepID=UPI002ABDEEAF|nr:hypothetical protein [Paraburkholderia sp. J12]